MKLERVLIVGAGLAGLALAISLRRQGSILTSSNACQRGPFMVPASIWSATPCVRSTPWASPTK
jgi:thioredoxin reductase